MGNLPHFGNHRIKQSYSQLCGVWNLLFCHHTAVMLTQKCVTQKRIRKIFQIFSLHTCIKLRERPNNFNLNMHTLPPSGLHSSTQFTSWGLTSIPTPSCAYFAGSTPVQESYPNRSSQQCESHDALSKTWQQHSRNIVCLKVNYEQATNSGRIYNCLREVFSWRQSRRKQKISSYWNWFHLNTSWWCLL